MRESFKDTITGQAPAPGLPKGNSSEPARATVSVAGSIVEAPSAEICGRTIVVTGRWLRIAAARDEDWQEGLALLAPGTAGGPNKLGQQN